MEVSLPQKHMSYRPLEESQEFSYGESMINRANTNDPSAGITSQMLVITEKGIS